MGIRALGCFANELPKRNLLCGTSGGCTSVSFAGLDNDEPGEQYWEGAHWKQRMECAVGRVLWHHLKVPAVISYKGRAQS